MRSIRTLIVDDEVQAIRRIERILMTNPDFEIGGTCLTAAEASGVLKKSRIDLLFIDIEMPGTDGISFVGALDEKTRPLVVFVTAYDEYAVLAFEYFAIDYILKPFSNERFMKTLERVRQQIRKDGRPEVDWHEMQNAITHKKLPGGRFVIKTGRKYEFLEYKEISYVLANGSYATLVCHDGRKALYRETISRLSELLKPYGFIRAHHSAIVLPSCIKGMNRLTFGYIEVVMNDGHAIRVSRRYKDDIIKVLH